MKLCSSKTISMLLVTACVIFFSAPAFATIQNASADLVLGQPDFVSNTPFTSQAGMRTPYDVAFDTSTGRVYVSDGDNNRVLWWNNATSLSNGQQADGVIGQATFTVGASSCSQTGLSGPAFICVDGSGNVWVADPYSNRVLRYPRPSGNGQAANLVLGQANFSTFASSCSQAGMNNPTGVSVDNSGNVWVADSYNQRVLKFTTPLSNGKPASLVLGQPNFNTFVSSCSQTGMGNAFNVCVDSSGNVWVADNGFNRVLKYANPASNGQPASLVLGQGNFSSSVKACTQAGLDQGSVNPNLCVSVDGSNNVWVADFPNNRVLKYMTPSVNGQLASLVLGQANFTSYVDTCSQTGFSGAESARVDASGNVWVSDANNSRVLRFSNISSSPSVVANLSAVPGAAQNTVILSWQAPSDDGANAPLSAGSSYYIQYGQSAGGPWNYLTAQVVISTSGVNPGTTVQFSIANIVPSTATYYFSIWAKNGPASGSNLSPQSVVASLSVPTTLSVITNGVWSSTATWQNGMVPWPNQDVNVPSALNVIFNRNDAGVTCGNIYVSGKLNFDVSNSTRCMTANGAIQIYNGGNFQITASTGYSSTLKIQSATDGQNGLIMYQGGYINIQGTPKNCYALMTATATSGATNITVDNISGFAVGDQIVIGTTQLPGGTERWAISGIGGNTITLSHTLTATHAKGAEVLNLSRNAVITSTGTGRSFINLQMYSSAIDSCTFAYAELSNLGQYSATFKDSLCLQGPARVGYCSVHDGANNGITLYNSGDAQITNNAVCNTAAYGIQIYGGSNNIIEGNHVVMAQSMGIYLTNSSHGNVIFENSSFSNIYDGLRLESTCDAIVHGNQLYSNSQFGVFTTASGSIYLRNMFDGNIRGITMWGANAVADCVFGGKVSNGADISAVFGGDARLYNSLCLSPTAVDANLSGGSDVLSFNHNLSSGSIRIWGIDKIHSGDVANANYSDDISSAMASAVTLVGSGSGSLSSLTLSNQLTETELWQVTFKSGAQYDVMRSSVPGIWVLSGSFAGGGYTDATRGVTFTVTNTGLKYGDAFYFATIAACRAQNTQKNIVIGQNTAGATGIYVDTGGQLNLKGQGGHETTITSDGLSYYSFNAYGTVGMSNFVATNMDAQGFVFSTAAFISELSTGTFDNIQNGGTYLTFNNLNESATFYALNFLDTPSHVANAVKAAGSNVNFTFANASGDKFGMLYTSATAGARIQWADTLVRPHSVTTVPLNNAFYSSLPVISGTANTSAGDATVGGVDVQLYDQNTAAHYWNGSAWQSTAAWVSANFVTNVWSLATPVFIDSHKYTLTPRAVDTKGRSEISLSSVSFVCDITPPLSAVTYPLNNQYYSSISPISGTCADPGAPLSGAGVAGVNVALNRVLDNKYWNGTAWQLSLAWNGATSVSSATWAYSSAVLSSLTSGYYYVNTAAYDNANATNVATVFSTSTFYIIGHATKLLTIMPGQVFAQGTGRSGTALNQTAGAPFVATAYAVDDNYYCDQAATPTVTVGLSDVYGASPAPRPLVGGATTFVINLLTATTVTVTVSAPNLAGDSQPVFVNPGPSAKFQLLVPGEGAIAGSPSGKTGFPIAQTAGISFYTTVNACDAYWNVISTAVPFAALSCNDGYSIMPSTAALSAGTTTFTVNLIRATTTVISVSAFGAYASNASGAVSVNPGAPAKLLLLMPGENCVFNGGNCRGGTPINQVSGSTFTIAVQALDLFGNKDYTSGDSIQCTSNDPNAIAPSPFSLSSGLGSTIFYFVNTGTFTITATDTNATPLSASTGSPVFVQDGTPPGAVTDLSAQPGTSDGSVALSWTTPGDSGYVGILQTGAQYKIEYSTSPAIAWANASAQIVVSSAGVAPGTKVQTAVNGLIGWTTYYFRIWYKDSANNISALSAGATAYATDLQGPTMPALLSPLSGFVTNITTVTVQSNLASDNGSGIKGYDYYVAASSDFAVIYASASNVNTSQGFTLAQGAWYWKARANDNAGNLSSWSNIWVLIIDTTPPSAPSLGSTPADGSIVPTPVTLNWGDSADGETGIAGYESKFYIDATLATLDYSSVTVTSDGYLPLAAGTFWWRARAIDLAGNYSAWSATHTFTAIASSPPATPTNFTLTVLSTCSLYMTWNDNANNETDYKIFDTNDSPLYTLPANTTYYLETGISPNTMCGRRVYAYNGISFLRSIKSADVIKYTMAEAPSALTLASAGAYSITLVWKAGAGGNTRYFVERSTNGVAYATRAEWADQLATASFTDTGLTSNTTYFYRVAGYNGDGIITAKTSPFVAVTAYVPPSVISGKVAQAKGTCITGVEIIAFKTNSIVSYTVHTSTDGCYSVALEQAIADGLYKVQATWIANGISATVYKDSIANGTDAVNFVLETNYELGSITGLVSIAATAPRRLAPSNGEPLSPAFVELFQNGKLIAKIPTKADGSYEIPNLMPGTYSVRSFNGVAYSRSSQVNLTEGQRLAMSFTYDLLQQDKVYCYPNPAVTSDNATIHFETSGQDIEIAVNIYTISGELVISASQSQITTVANVCEYKWNLQNCAGSRVASGVYLVQVKVRDKNTGETANATKKLAVIR